MADQHAVDLEAAHKHFAAHCFNAAWDLIDKAARTPEEDRLMVALNQASIYHWLQRPDCDNRRLSVGYWQASRIQVLTGNASAALRCAEDALAYACDLSPFYTAYAHEAVARAARLGGDENRVQEHLAQAQALAAQVSDPAEREMLLKDLGTV